jgi:hypothetical protein
MRKAESRKQKAEKRRSRLHVLSFCFLLSAFCFSCDPIVRKMVTFAFDPTGERVTISATTSVGQARPKTAEYAEAEDERSALLAERDEWSARFAQLNPESERVTFERSRGRLDSVERRATVASDQLQKFFFDTPITVTTTRGEGWMELTMYAGTSNRASQAQRRQAEKMLDAYSGRAVSYINAVKHMYAYLEEHPQRAHVMFTAIFEEDERMPILSETEKSLTDRVRESIMRLADTQDMEADATVDRLFDLTYNPFPSQVRVIIKGIPLATEGFTRADSETFEIRPPTALQAVASLEGRWVSPDPLAIAFKGDDKREASEVAQSIESLPRRYDPVVAKSEVAAALIEKLQPAPRYRLRWTTKPPAS